MGTSGDKAVLQKQAILPEFLRTACQEKMGKHKQLLYQKLVLLTWFRVTCSQAVTMDASQPVN